MSGPDKQKKICQDVTEFCRDPTKQTKICQVLAKYFSPGFEQVSLILAESVGTRQNLSELESFVST